MAALGLPAKEYQRHVNQVTLSDLSTRQLAVTVSGVYPFVLPTDLKEMGGDLEAWLTWRVWAFLSTTVDLPD